jgi:hypothetical protein
LFCHRANPVRAPVANTLPKGPVSYLVGLGLGVSGPAIAGVKGAAVVAFADCSCALDPLVSSANANQAPTFSEAHAKPAHDKTLFLVFGHCLNISQFRLANPPGSNLKDPPKSSLDRH